MRDGVTYDPVFSLFQVFRVYIGVKCNTIAERGRFQPKFYTMRAPPAANFRYPSWDVPRLRRSQALTAGGGGAASIAKMYILALAGARP